MLKSIENESKEREEVFEEIRSRTTSDPALFAVLSSCLEHEEPLLPDAEVKLGSFYEESAKVR